MIKRIFNLLLCSILLFNLMGCSYSSGEKIGAEIEMQLESKYGKQFTVSSLGGRNAEKKGVTAYVYADEDPTMLFTIRMNSENNTITYNNYEYRLVLRKIENMINSAFAKYGIESVCYIESSLYDDSVGTNITAYEYIQNYKPEWLSIAQIIKDGNNVTASNIEKVYKEIHRELDNQFLGIGLYVITSNDYDVVADKVMRETQIFDEYRLSLKGTKDNIKEVIFRISNNKLSVSLDEIDNALSIGR